jgi:hypothetical protein
MKLYILISIFLLVTLITAAQPAKNEMIQIMVLGTYHMGNPGLDLHNMKADDVTAPKRQKELKSVASSLAKFNPTKVAVERLAPKEDLIDAKYSSFTPDLLKTNPDERIQIAYRLAHSLQLTQVYAIDEQSDTIDYFPFDKVKKFVEEKGSTAYLQEISASVEKKVKGFEQLQNSKTISELLMIMNTPDEAVQDQKLGYYSLLKLSDAAKSPGADLNAYWYMRNAKIFSKLLRVSQPGDRVIVLFGAGHNFWLRHFAQNTEGCELIEPNDFLAKAAK